MCVDLCLILTNFHQSNIHNCVLPRDQFLATAGVMPQLMYVSSWTPARPKFFFLSLPPKIEHHHIFFYFICHFIASLLDTLKFCHFHLEKRCFYLFIYSSQIVFDLSRIHKHTNTFIMSSLSVPEKPATTAPNRRRSSSIINHIEPETIDEQSDQSSLPNLNADWVNSKGMFFILYFYLFLF